MNNVATPVSAEFLYTDELMTSLAVAQNTLVIGDDSISGNQGHFVKDFHFAFATLTEAIAILNSRPLAAIFVSESVVDKTNLQFNYVLSFAAKNRTPVFLYSKDFSPRAQNLALELKFDDYYCGDLTINCVNKIKLTQKLNAHWYKQQDAQKTALANNPKVKKWVSKRAFDIIFSLTLLILLSPIMLVIALIIKLGSKGPVFYISKRAGTGYKIFDFYKFRSMRKGADGDLKKLSGQNQYSSSVFFKIQDDPRVTRFGKFLRSTSLDELPQLFNVLKGDMSLVGNRPLPLYEAERLTKDGDVRRFLAPAGITGLWQVTKRGKKDMSDTERIQLDIIYARKISFAYDLKILLSTFPALIQQEKV